ncbi:MAG: DUF308 domain-containing protein [Oscillospiraceae bacterium]|nr:DUF308 domain-containing protein [Oscillospiraceae bacterium]
MSFETKTMEKNPVVKTAKWAMSLMKNKIIVSLLMLVSGILFLVAPSGNMNGTVITIAIIVIVFALINIGIHLIPKDRTKMDIFLSVVNVLLIGFSVFCLIFPSTVEPIVRYVFAVLTIISNLVNLIEVLKFENKKSWRFAVGLIVAVIMIGLGIGMLIAGETVIASMQQGIGVFLIINAVINIWYIIHLWIEAKRTKKN